MMEKLAQACVGGGARPPPFPTVTIKYKVAMYAPAEWADTIPLLHLFPYVLCGFTGRVADTAVAVVTPPPSPTAEAWRRSLTEPTS